MKSQSGVLHTVEVFLPVTENWIYPQITGVAGVESAVLCKQTTNLPEFPLDGRPLFRRALTSSRLQATGGAVGRSLFRILGAAADAMRLRKWQPSLLHAHFGTLGWEAILLKRLLNVPLVTSFYGYDAWKLPTAFPRWRRRLTRLFAAGDAFLVEGSAFRERLIALGCPPEKIHVQRLGMPVAETPFRQRDFQGTIRAVMMGRFVAKKGFSDGLEACSRAVAAGHDLQIAIVGDARQDDAAGQAIKQALQAIAARPHMQGRVQFHGMVSPGEARGILQACDILLCPSKHDAEGDAEGGLPFVVPQAMAMGLLCIGSRHCDIPEAILHGKTGYLFEEGDAGGLAALLAECFADPDGLAQMCRAGRAHIEACFNLETLLIAQARLYGDLLAGTA